MKSLLDSERLLAIVKSPWWVFAAIATASGLLVWLSAEDPTWFPQLSPSRAVIVWVAGLLSFFLLAFRLTDEVWKVVPRKGRTQILRVVGPAEGAPAGKIRKGASSASTVQQETPGPDGSKS